MDNTRRAWAAVAAAAAEQDGVTAVEYGLLAGLVGLLLALALTNIGTSLAVVFATLAAAI